MSFYYITSGNRFTGNAQLVSGSAFEGLGLGNLNSGSKYEVAFQYRSNVPLNIYSANYSNNYTVLS